MAGTPEESLEASYVGIREELAREMLQRVRACSPEFFERLVVELLVRMGYGGNRTEAGKAVGGTGDEGVDGVISEDRLGLDLIYVQAKKWEATVGRPEIQKFVGALTGKRARKGVFMTTSDFSSEARDYVAHIEPRIVLIDGRQLADFMIDSNVGVTPRRVYEIKRVDLDFFGEE
jgi:restriction system protein